MASDLEYSHAVAESFRDYTERDPLRKLNPHEKQTRFYDSTFHECLFLGANRSGKTHILVAHAARAVRYRGAKLGWIVSLSNAMSMQNIVPLLFSGEGGIEPFIPANEIADIRWKPEIQVIGKEGWVITLKSCEQGADKFAGAACDFIDFDEPPTWPVYKECAIRIGANRQCEIRMAATMLPPVGQAGGVCSWLWSEKIEPWLKGKNRQDVDIVQVALDDNPYIPEEQKALARRLYAPGSLDRRIRVDGELLPGLIGDRAYQAFERRIHVNKMIGPHSVDPMKPMYLGVDFNVDPLCGVILQKHNTIWRALDEIALRPGTVPELGEQVCKRYPAHRNDLVIVGDAMGRNRTAQTGKTDYDLLAAALQDTFRVRLDVPIKNPPVRDRVNVVNYLLGGGHNEVLFEISDHCPELIADLEQVLWKPDGSDLKKSRDKSDPYYQRTHTSDGTSYVLHEREQHILQKARRGGERRRNGRRHAPHYGFAA